MSRTLCPDCGAGRGLATYGDTAWCFACHKLTNFKSLVAVLDTRKSPLDIPTDLTELPIKAKQWLYQYYITDEHIAKYNIQWSEATQRILFPYNKAKSAWARSINPDVRNKWLHLGTVRRKYAIFKDTMDQVCIVEDVISAIRVGDYVTCVCNGGTSIDKLNPVVAESKQTLLWFDGDLAGRKATEKFRERFKLFLNIVDIVTKKDPKCHTPSEMGKILHDRIISTKMSGE